MRDLKILIVDDETEIVSYLSKRLSQDGFTVFSSASGTEAVALAKNETPDLILMDIVLPDIDGSEAVARLQADRFTARIPIIFLSGIVTPEDGQASSQVHIAGQVYRALAKPFSYNDLMKEIQRVNR